jgi:hypothetical protein
VELATEALFLVGAVRLTPAGLLGWRDVRDFVRVLAAGIALVALATLLRPYGLVPAFVGGCAAFVVTATAVGVLRLEQLRAVRAALRLS